MTLTDPYKTTTLLYTVHTFAYIAIISALFNSLREMYHKYDYYHYWFQHNFLLDTQRNISLRRHRLNNAKII